MIPSKPTPFPPLPESLGGAVPQAPAPEKEGVHIPEIPEHVEGFVGPYHGVTPEDVVSDTFGDKDLVDRIRTTLHPASGDAFPGGKPHQRGHYRQRTQTRQGR